MLILVDVILIFITYKL